MGRSGAARWWTMRPLPDQRPFMQCTVCGVEEGWRVIELIAVPAAAQPSALGLPTDRCPGGVVLTPTGRPESLLRFVSSRAFRSLSLKLVKDLLALLRTAGEPLQPQPKTEFDWVRALILQVEPGLDASIVDERIETWRGRPLHAERHATLTEKAAMESEGILEKDDETEGNEVAAKTSCGGPARMDQGAGRRDAPEHQRLLRLQGCAITLQMECHLPEFIRPL